MRMPKRISRRLTAKEVVSLSKTPGVWAISDNLYLSVVNPSSRAWVFRYQIAGKRREMGLGPYPLVSLAHAREAADGHRRRLVDGVDPLEQRKSSRVAARIEAAKAVTFEECAARYISDMSVNWSVRSIDQWRASLRDYAFPVMAELPVAAIDTALVTKVLEQIWLQRPETARRVRGRIENILDWGKTRGYREGENPARWRGHLENLLPKKPKGRVVHLAAMPYAEIPGFMARLRRQEGTPARALELGILTLLRTGRELLGARWEEFDWDEALWAVPAERMKNKRLHRVPLAPAAIAIVEQQAAIRHSDHVFPGMREGRPIYPGAMLTLLKEMGCSVTVHGFRSSFADWAAERTSFPTAIREMALAHSVGSAVEQSYRRTDLLDARRALAEEWARFLGSAELPIGN